MAGNRAMAAHGKVRNVPGGVALDGVHSFLDGGDFHGKCLGEPDKCQKGFTVAIQVSVIFHLNIYARKKDFFSPSHMLQNVMFTFKNFNPMSKGTLLITFVKSSVLLFVCLRTTAILH